MAFSFSHFKKSDALNSLSWDISSFNYFFPISGLSFNFDIHIIAFHH